MPSAHGKVQESFLPHHGILWRLFLEEVSCLCRQSLLGDDKRGILAARPAQPSLSLCVGAATGAEKPLSNSEHGEFRRGHGAGAAQGFFCGWETPKARLGWDKGAQGAERARRVRGLPGAEGPAQRFLQPPRDRRTWLVTNPTLIQGKKLSHPQRFTAELVAPIPGDISWIAAASRTLWTQTQLCPSSWEVFGMSFHGNKMLEETRRI